MKVALIMFTLLAGAVPVRAQQSMPPPSVQSGMPTVRPGFGGGAMPESDRTSAATRERLEVTRQSDRQKRMIADTEKLLTLATQLKEEMDKTTKDTLSIDVIKKAEEIEKLARSVKERMKG